MKDEIGIQSGHFAPENIPSGSSSSPYSTHTCVMEFREQNRAICIVGVQFFHDYLNFVKIDFNSSTKYNVNFLDKYIFNYKPAMLSLSTLYIA